MLFENVNVFDGETNELSMGMSVLVNGNKILKIAKLIKAPAGATVIDGGSCTLMPGIIEAHSHLAMAAVNVPELLTQLPSYTTIISVLEAEKMLFNGVTTTRDMGGEVFGLKRAIDGGKIIGPRIYPSGPIISQTSGHADFRFPSQPNPSLSGSCFTSDLAHHFALVDGVPKMLATVREQLRLGASQIKLAIGGGVSSPSDPVDVTEFTKDEIAAAVAAAENWGTYVTAHGYTPHAVNQALDAGVRVIEHGHLLDRDTLERMAKEGVWLSFQPFKCREPKITLHKEKQSMVCEGTDNIYEMIKNIHDLKVVHGTDIFLNPPDGNDEQVKQMERLLKWLTPFEILKMSTSNVGELLKLCGPRNPYPGDLGVVKEGAYADLLMVQGNPLEDIRAVTDRDNLKIIMKDGVIYKNTLNQIT